MKTKSITGSIKLPKTKKLCKLYQQLGNWAENTNRLPDAQQVKNNKPVSVSLELLPMVF
ncbi:hypothetical protein [Flavobacterium sp. PL02]|uniref:hypothetical protein n=1 Tax=Flavobacterium sp. PL02 TaxID=3088354 RepID=UPI002B22FDE9|nr:hypothetical protein [Flavobacterium sp. PL02]MEA9414334.1 hypothetical protein [Flavobacterium sp. PL02]